jgi:hypothetical protein
MHTKTKETRRPVRRPLPVGQPESLSELRPSQRRAAQNREAIHRQASIALWLRRLGRAGGH